MAKVDFWSRRKAAVAAEQERLSEGVPEAGPVEAEVSPEDVLTDEEALESLGLRPPEELSRGDDFTAYLARAVPKAVRARALNVLWRSNPVLANVDGLVEYGLDYTDAAMASRPVTTSYIFGKGLRAHVESLAEKAKIAAERCDDDEALPDPPQHAASVRVPERPRVTRSRAEMIANAEAAETRIAAEDDRATPEHAPDEVPASDVVAPLDAPEADPPSRPAPPMVFSFTDAAEPAADPAATPTGDALPHVTPRPEPE